jgi:opacity protein-like surface antigen
MRRLNQYKANQYKANTHRIFGRIAFAASLLVLLSNSVQAAEPAFFQASFFGGYSLGGHFYKADTTSQDPELLNKGPDTDQLKIKSSPNFGVALNLRQADNAYYELIYSRQDATIDPSFQHAYDMSIEYLHVGGFVEFGDPKAKVVPYFVLTVGATRLTPIRSDFERTIEPSIAMGGGVRIPFTKNIGLRLEGRGYATFIKPESNLFCAPSTTLDANGNPVKVCETNIQGHSLLQAQASLALTIGF